MEKFMTNTWKALMFITVFIFILSCSDDDDDMTPDIDPPDNTVTVVNSMEYDLGSKAVASISGKAIFKEYSDNTVTIELELVNTPAGGQHPAHIHFNSAAEGGGIALTLGTVDGDTGKSVIPVTELNDGTAINYDQLIAFDGYINVHLSSDELQTIVAQGDIGNNDLTGVSQSYSLNEKAVPGIEGAVTFYERVNGESLAVIELNNTPEGGVHPAHIHNNSAAEGGGIAVSLTPIDGTTGKSHTNIASLDDGTALNYDQLVAFDGYINVHLSSDELQTIVAQGDIGSNALTGVSQSYSLNEKAVAGIEGTVTFFERMNGESLALIELNNTPEGGVHPAHIHNNSAAEGGGIAVSLTPVDGATGKSYTNISSLDDGTAIDYTDLLNFDGYINVHLSAEELNVIVGQGDIGQNELTGSSVVYGLSEKAVPGISGEVTFFERKSGESLAIIDLNNTPAGGSHPAHIHNNDAATGGGIAFTFNPVNGDTGRSTTHVEQLDDGTPFGYESIKNFNGYINVHLSSDDLSTIVAQGNIGANVGSGGGSGGGNSYAVSNSGSTAYVFTGGDLENESNPDFTFKRGETYTFNVNASGHPFLIKTTETTGTGDAYNEGVTNNGIESGTITFTVSADAPDTLYYICEFHRSMSGTINIVD